MTKSIEKYWFAVGFWHGKSKNYCPPSQAEIEYIKDVTDIDIEKEYEKGYKAGSR